MTTAIEFPPKHLHMVSEVLLARFCGPGRKLIALNVEHPTSRPLLRSPRQVAFTEELNPMSPTDFEGLWKPIEDRLGPAIDAVEAGTIFEAPTHLETMRECLALHWARSNTMERVARVARDHALAVEEQRLENHPELVSRAGLVPVGREGKKWVAKQRVAHVAANEFRHEVLAPERMMANFHKMREILRGQPFEVAVATDGEFIVGDTPAHAFDSDFVADVPLDRAKTLTMPIGRRHAVGMSVMSGYSELPTELVDVLNNVQVSTAVKRVMWHPDADVVDFVRSGLA